MRETAFLTQKETDLLKEMKRIAPFLKKQGAKTLELFHSQFQIFSGICRKAKKNPTFDYAEDINPDKGEFCGVPVVSVEKRARYKRKDSLDLFA